MIDKTEKINQNEASKFNFYIKTHCPKQHFYDVDERLYYLYEYEYDLEIYTLTFYVSFWEILEVISTRNYRSEFFVLYSSVFFFTVFFRNFFD